MSSSVLGQLFIVSAPSGAGKTTLVERLVERVPRLRMSRSYTSRSARPGEADAVDYNFVTRERFESMIAASDFLEWADVFGNLYGTCASDTERLLADVAEPVFGVDVMVAGVHAAVVLDGDTLAAELALDSVLRGHSHALHV